jgi:hypothetical protein
MEMISIAYPGTGIHNAIYRFADQQGNGCRRRRRGIAPCLGRSHAGDDARTAAGTVVHDVKERGCHAAPGRPTALGPVGEHPRRSVDAASMACAEGGVDKVGRGVERVGGCERPGARSGAGRIERLSWGIYRGEPDAGTTAPFPRSDAGTRRRRRPRGQGRLPPPRFLWIIATRMSAKVTRRAK